MTVQERLRDLITGEDKLNMSQMGFSLSIGKSQSWASTLFQRDSDISASDILKIEEVHSVNPLYILKGEHPIFLKNKLSKQKASGA